MEMGFCPSLYVTGDQFAGHGETDLDSSADAEFADSV